MSKLKHSQRYMNTFELDCIKFEILTKRHQLSTIFQSTIEEVFETLEKENLDLSTSHSIIEPIVNQDYGNTFHHQNGPNHLQPIHKNTSRQYQSITYQIPRT